MSEIEQGSDTTPLQFVLPSTVSAQWKDAFGRMVEEVMKTGGLQPQPHTDNPDEWDAANVLSNRLAEALAAPVLTRLGTQRVERELGGVPVVEYIPKKPQRNGARIIYTHGGGYTGGSALANAVAAAVMADLLEEPVLSIDYTLAPRGHYDTVTDEVVAVFDALANGGMPTDRTVLFGDSAGGGLAVASILKLRDQGKPMPAATALWSPFVDLRCEGDTIRTLRHADFFDPEKLAFNMNMYAGPDHLTHPYASPIYGDFSKGFPPALVQAGTREILLSDSVRLYQALDVAGCTVKLDIYEGMPHVHQSWPTGTETPEAMLACRKTAQFLRHWLQRSTA
ncbi:alpha/beta hydrolase fold domain-containing protein [Paraburkholderia metrosideri]|uniref:Alpha/beta hydrolase fold domain-containing protein n=1 Tax=Paraburkholderia metrosideri TaxID=580937 RepID=A0ABW9DUD3_9BURK